MESPDSPGGFSNPLGADLLVRVLFGCGVTWGCGVNSVRGERVAQGVEHVHRGWVGFGGVPGGVSAAFGDLRFGGGVGGVPQDGDRLGHECEGDAALNGFFDPVLGFADAGDVFPVVEADFDGPAGRVAGDDLGGGCGHVGGDYCDVVVLVGGGLAVAVFDQDDPDRVGAPDPEPEAGDLGGARGDGGAVPVDQGVGPGVVLVGLGGDIGGGADAFAAQSGSAAFPAGRRCGVVEHGVAAGSGGEGDVAAEAGEVSGAVGGVADEVNCSGGEGFCDLVEEVAAEVGFAAATFDAQGEQDGQCDRASAERQGDHDRQDDPAVAVADLLGAGGGAVVPPGRGEDFRSAPPGQGFVDGEQDRRVGREQQVHDQGGQDQADLPDVPAGAREEPVGVVPHTGQAGAGQHSTHR